MGPYRNSPTYLKKCQICNDSGLIITYPMGCRDEEICSCVKLRKQELIERFGECQKCNGDGVIITFPMGCRDEETCSSCNGTGIIK